MILTLNSVLSYSWQPPLHRIIFPMYSIQYFEADETAPTFALQPEVCITPFISESILRQAFNYELPHSEEIFRNGQPLLSAGNMRRLTDSQTFVYFTADGLYTVCCFRTNR